MPIERRGEEDEMKAQGTAVAVVEKKNEGNLTEATPMRRAARRGEDDER